MANIIHGAGAIRDASDIFFDISTIQDPTPGLRSALKGMKALGGASVVLTLIADLGLLSVPDPDFAEVNNKLDSI